MKTKPARPPLKPPPPVPVGPETVYQVLNHTPAAICMQRGPAHRYEYVNAAYQQLFPGRRFVGHTVAEALPETTAAGFVALLDAVYHTGTTHFGHETPLTLAAHEGHPAREVYFTFTYQAYREAGVIVGISTVAHDVTSQVRQREALHRQQQELEEQGRRQVQALNEQLATTNADLHATNTALGLQNAELRRTHQHLQRLNRTLDAREAERTATATAARDECEATATRLRLITDALPVLIGYVDREQRYQFTNHAYEAWFGQPAAALLGRTVRAVVGEAAYAAAQGHIERALAGERLDFEARMPYRPDFVKYIRTSFVPDVRDGAVLGFYSLVSDVTEQALARQQVERANEQLALLNDRLFATNEEQECLNEELGATNEELDEANQQLTRINVDLDTFVYTASHDLKDPITNLDGLVHALWEELAPTHQAGPAAHILGLMQGAVDRFQRTLGQLGAIGQLQQERGQQLAPARLPEVIADVRLDLAPLILAAHAQVEVDIVGFPSFPFAEKNLRSVVYNLLSNALKYRHPDRTPLVRLSCQLAPPYWVLAVQDNGLGLRLTPDRPLFGLFQRYHTHVEGSGVGLYMVKKMLENAGGRIEVASEVGVGSTFTAYFRY